MKSVKCIQLAMHKFQTGFRSGWYKCRSKWPTSRAVPSEDGKGVEGGEEVFKFVKGEEGNGD